MTYKGYLQYNLYICTSVKVNIQTMAKVLKVFHLELNGEHHYFGSKKAIFDLFGKEDIGITYASFRNFDLSTEKPFKNSKCTIREGVLITTPKKSSTNVDDEIDN